jgi:hypothetical protein
MKNLPKKLRALADTEEGGHDMINLPPRDIEMLRAAADAIEALEHDLARALVSRSPDLAQ